MTYEIRFLKIILKFKKLTLADCEAFGKCWPPDVLQRDLATLHGLLAQGDIIMRIYDISPRTYLLLVKKYNLMHEAFRKRSERVFYDN